MEKIQLLKLQQLHNIHKNSIDNVYKLWIVWNICG